MLGGVGVLEFGVGILSTIVGEGKVAAPTSCAKKIMQFGTSYLLSTGEVSTVDAEADFHCDVGGCVLEAAPSEFPVT